MAQVPQGPDITAAGFGLTGHGDGLAILSGSGQRRWGRMPPWPSVPKPVL